MAKPRKPTALKLLKGTDQPCRRAPELPAATGFRKHPPKRLATAQRGCWREIATSAPAGLLAPSDEITVEIAACLLAEYRADPSGMNAARLARLQITLTKLGLDPQGRAALPVQQPKRNTFDDV